MKKFLVIAHVYYHDLWYILDRCIQNLPKDSFDLIVTTTSNIEELSSKVKEHSPNAKVELCENRGYDIWPFIKVLKSVKLDEYEFLIKLHTKEIWARLLPLLIINISLEVSTGEICCYHSYLQKRILINV